MGLDSMHIHFFLLAWKKKRLFFLQDPVLTSRQIGRSRAMGNWTGWRGTRILDERVFWNSCSLFPLQVYIFRLWPNSFCFGGVLLGSLFFRAHCTIYILFLWRLHFRSGGMSLVGDHMLRIFFFEAPCTSVVLWIKFGFLGGYYTLVWGGICRRHREHGWQWD